MLRLARAHTHTHRVIADQCVVERDAGRQAGRRAGARQSPQGPNARSPAQSQTSTMGSTVLPDTRRKRRSLEM